MNFPRIEANEYSARIEAFRKRMAAKDVDLVVGFSNLLEIGIVRYYCGFAPTIEEAITKLAQENNRNDAGGEVIVPRRIISILEKKYESKKGLGYLCSIYLEEYLK